MKDDEVPELIALPDDIEASRPEKETQAFMRFRDENGAVRFGLRYVPDKPGFVPGSPAHEAAMRAHGELERVMKAVSDAILRRPGGDVAVVSKERINALNGNEE